jgi:hypothetical protein
MGQASLGLRLAREMGPNNPDIFTLFLVNYMY